MHTFSEDRLGGHRVHMIYGLQCPWNLSCATGTFVFSSGLEIPSRNRSYFRTSWRGREGAPRCFFMVTVSNKKILEEYKLAKILASISFYSSYYITLYYTCFCRTMYTSLNNRCLSDSICEHDPAWLVNGTMVQRFHI